MTQAPRPRSTSVRPGSGFAGAETVVALFCARLAHSTCDVVVAYPAENRATWFDGHVRAFETWGGAPAEVWYDNPSGLGSFRRGTFHPAPEFLALQSAHRFGTGGARQPDC